MIIYEILRGTNFLYNHFIYFSTEMGIESRFGDKLLYCFQVLVSPVLAGLAVGIGVPILLFYVYGVVPVSLCRSGGCGVSTNGTGVRFDFDDENELMGTLGPRNGGGKYVSSYSTITQNESL